MIALALCLSVGGVWDCIKPVAPVTPTRSIWSVVKFVSAGDSDSADGAADRIIPRPRVQVVIYSDSPRCAPCRQLIARLKQKLVDEVRARGDRPWNVGEEQSNQFWICEFADNPKEFERRGIRQMPTLFFVVDGEEKETSKRDPAELAAEYLKRLESIK